MKYIVSVDDNYHYQDETERTEKGGYDTAEEAIEAAKQIVLDSLRWQRWQIKGEATAEELWDRYTSFGDDPFIRGVHFSAWDYAKSMCETIAAEPPMRREDF